MTDEQWLKLEFVGAYVLFPIDGEEGRVIRHEVRRDPYSGITLKRTTEYPAALVTYHPSDNS